VEKITKEYDKNGRPYTIVAYFRAYKNMSDSFLDHGIFLTGKRYRKALDAYAKSKDASEFARGLQEAGYATDPKYAEKLISLMKRYDLYQYNPPKSEPESSLASRRKRRASVRGRRRDLRKPVRRSVAARKG
jgi:flagellum-specific peptidoglycan hydrolase FlgJ